jgi:precorrin-3B C17-methyltransferase
MARQGTLAVVGIGPGSEEHLTPAARRAIAGAETVVGYGAYLDLVAPLLEGKALVRGRMTGEVERVAEAVARARAGARVALVSSGDAGVYGMASLALETLRAAGWRQGDAPALTVVPGVTALLACAARVGAPLGHDFCAVSLSDLLTPWPVVARRLEAAGAGDFVVGLYNPASARRRRPLEAAREILLRHRAPGTPVAVVTAVDRAEERVALGDLAGLLDLEVGMTSTVIVGSSRTVRWEGLLLTPRGYSDKYLPDGAPRPGERPGAPRAGGERP